MSRPPVSTGLQRLVDEGFNALPRGLLAVLTHQCAVDARGKHLLHHLATAGRKPALVLSPEHGLWSTHQDMESVGEPRDPVFGMPVHSLYGDDQGSLDPAASLLDSIDVLVADMQDVGARYYTYAATLLRCMRVAQHTGTRVVVLDRPNPINGMHIEGNLVSPGFNSFVGDIPVPNRHGMTLGELALFAREIEGLDTDLEVIRMEGWNRESFYWETELLWVPPSPNMPTPGTALVYPGMCLLEGTNLSEGRGTTTPFEVFGAPWVEPLELVQAVAREPELHGFIMAPCAFRPQFGKWAGQVCRGARIHVTDPTVFRSLPLALVVIRHILHRHDADFAWRHQPYEFVSDRLAIDLLLGHDQPRTMLEAGEDVEAVVALLAGQRSGFENRRNAMLLY